MVCGFCVYFVYMIPLETDVLRKHRFQKLNVTLARPLRLVILYFLNGKSCQMIGACIFMTANETRDQMWMGSHIQNNC